MKAEVASLISDKIDLKIKKNTKDKEGHCIRINGSIQEEDITICTQHRSIPIHKTNTSILKRRN